MKTLISLLICSQYLFCQPKTFSEFIDNLHHETDSITKSHIISEYLSGKELPVVEKDSLHFVYRGKGDSVSVPGELNGWNPPEGKMLRVAGTDFFYRSYRLPDNARVEYKLLVDNNWQLDPRNPRITMGGYGENSSAQMPRYRPLSEATVTPSHHGGIIDTLWIESRFLRHKHPVYIYIPYGFKAGKEYPEIFVTDGGEYLSLAGMHAALDNLIAAKYIRPVVGIFIDPRTDPSNSASTHRIGEYAVNDTFMNFLQHELTPYVERKYSFTSGPDQRLIMGASMGGVISTYAVLHHSDFILNCAAQSPAYLQADSAVIRIADSAAPPKINVWIDTGIFYDTQREAFKVKSLLEQHGVNVKYTEVPEGHNWTNWKNRIPGILTYFFPGK